MTTNPHFHMASSWAETVKAEDPMGFYSRSSPEEVEAARRAGQQAFETAENPFAPKMTGLNAMDPQKMKELIAYLGGADDGRPLNPVKLKELQANLHPDDPWQASIREQLAMAESRGLMMDAPGPDGGDGPPADLRQVRQDNLAAQQEKNAGVRTGS